MLLSTLSLHDALPISILSARNANEKLNVAVIGVANRGAENLRGVAHESVVALCDVDPENAKKAREQFPKAADRKSTRLNSSHLVISYAVFCLKKKKNK